MTLSSAWHPDLRSHRLLLLTTFFALVDHPNLTDRDFDAIRRTALPTFFLAPSIDLGHQDRSTLQRLFHKPVELFATLLLRLISHRYLLLCPDLVGEHVGLGLIEQRGRVWAAGGGATALRLKFQVLQAFTPPVSR